MSAAAANPNARKESARKGAFRTAPRPLVFTLADLLPARTGKRTATGPLVDLQPMDSHGTLVD
jgi:hypothetical protein